MEGIQLHPGLPAVSIAIMLKHEKAQPLEGIRLRVSIVEYLKPLPFITVH